MRYSLLSLFVVCFSFLSAQDRIQLVSGEDVFGKVLEVGEEIRYRQADFPDGPIYVLQRPEVAIITYSNGREEFFNVRPSQGGENSFAVRENYLRIQQNNRFYEGFRLISRAEFEQKLQSVPGSYEHYTSGRNMQTAGYVFAGLGLVITTVGLSTNVKNTFDTSTSFNASSSSANKGTGGLIAGMTMLLGSGALIGAGLQKVNRSVDEYNIAVGQRVGLKPAITNDGIGLVLQF